MFDNIVGLLVLMQSGWGERVGQSVGPVVTDSLHFNKIDARV